MQCRRPGGTSARQTSSPSGAVDAGCNWGQNVSLLYNNFSSYINMCPFFSWTRRCNCPDKIVWILSENLYMQLFKTVKSSLRSVQRSLQWPSHCVCSLTVGQCEPEAGGGASGCWLLCPPCAAASVWRQRLPPDTSAERSLCPGSDPSVYRSTFDSHCYSHLETVVKLHQVKQHTYDL